MGETGVFGEDDRVELIDGEIVEMTPIGTRHAACVARLTHLFFGRLGARVVVWAQNPLPLSMYDEPQPDLVLLLPRDDFYERAHPGPADTLLAIEVADTSLAYDRDAKLPRYALAAVPEVWIVDLEHREVLVRREPSGSGYRVEETKRPGDSLEITALPGESIPVAEIFGG